MSDGSRTENLSWMLGTEAKAQDNSRGQEALADLHEAGLLQRSLWKIPDSIGVFETGLAIEAAHEISGDILVSTPRHDKRHLIAIGDVSGHGAAAAFLSGQVAMATRIVGMVCSSLPEGCSKLNQIMYGKMADRYASLLVMTIDGAQGVMAWVRCGHLPPIHISDGGSRYEILTSGGAAIGLQPVAQFDKALKTETAIPEPGDRIILYTDGINESRSRNDSGDELTVKGLAAIASDMITRHPDISSSMLAQRILDFVRHRSGASRLEDDACVLVIRRK